MNNDERVRISLPVSRGDYLFLKNLSKETGLTVTDILYWWIEHGIMNAEKLKPLSSEERKELEIPPNPKLTADQRKVLKESYVDESDSSFVDWLLSYDKKFVEERNSYSVGNLYDAWQNGLDVGLTKAEDSTAT